MTLYEMVGLTSDEYELIVELLGREPNELEHVWSDVVGTL